MLRGTAHGLAVCTAGAFFMGGAVRAKRAKASTTAATPQRTRPTSTMPSLDPPVRLGRSGQQTFVWTRLPGPRRKRDRLAASPNLR